MSLAPFNFPGQTLAGATQPASGYGLDVDTGTGIPFIIDSTGVKTVLGGAAPSAVTPVALSVAGAGVIGTGLTYARSDHAHAITALTDTTHGTRGGGSALHPDATGALSGFLTPAQFTKLSTLSGTNTGDLTLGTVGSTPNASGASLSGQILTLQPANNTTPGLLTEVAQPIGGVKTFSSQIVGSISGLAGSATVLATPRAINGVSFDGSAPITVAAAAGTLTGTTLAAGVTGSSLTSVGTLTGLTVTAAIAGSVTGSAATLTTPRAINGTNFDGSAPITVTAAAGTLTGTTLAGGVTASSLTSVGTLAGLTVTATIVGSVSGNAATVTTIPTLSGDVSNIANAVTLATVATGSTTGGSTAIPVVTFNNKGLVTAITTAVVIAPAGTLSGTTLAAGVTASSLTSVGTLAALTVTATITGSVSGTAGGLSGTALSGDVSNIGNAITLASVGTPGTYGDATHIPIIVTDAKGRVTGVTTTTFTSGGTPGVFLVTANNGGAGATGNNVTDDTAAINRAIAAAVAYTGVGAFGARGAQVYFPPGVYLCNSALTSPANDGIVLQGAGRASVTLNVNFATGDFISLTSGKGNCQIRGMQFNANVARSSGAFINTNGANDVLIEDFQMSGAFEGIAVTGGSIKVTIENGTINSTVAATGTGIRVENGAAGDTYIGPYLVFSNNPASKPLAGIRVRQSGHFEIRGCNVTSCVTGLLVDPAAGEDVTYGFISDSLFDSCGTNGMLINPANSATARVRSLKFVDSWFAGTTAGGGAGAFLSTQGASAIVDDLEFTSCRFLNNQTHGMQHAFGTNIRVNGGTAAGNSAASSGVSDGINIAPGVSNFTIGMNKAGQAGTAGNTQRFGIRVEAGASDNYTVVNNDCLTNVTGGFSDLGTGLNKIIGPNLGGPVKGLISTLITPLATFALTTETLVLSAKIPANATAAGQAYWITLAGLQTAACTQLIKVRAGAAGTVAGDALVYSGISQATGLINSWTQHQAMLVVKSVGGAGTIVGVQAAPQQGGGLTAVTGETTAAAVTPTIVTTAAWFIDITLTLSVANAFTVHVCTIVAL